MLYVFGVGEIPISISGDPANPSPLLRTIRATGTVSRAMQALKQGDVLGMLFLSNGCQRRTSAFPVCTASRAGSHLNRLCARAVGVWRL